MMDGPQFARYYFTNYWEIETKTMAAGGLVHTNGIVGQATAAHAQEALPFPEPASASTAGKTLADSKHQWRTTESHLPADAPNIVIFMTDDAGSSNPETFGGPIHMPTMDRLAASGISYNAFHTTAC